MRYSEEYITKLNHNQIFVFGSNEAGIHGAGAAKLTIKFGAKMGHGFGLVGNTFAIPTKDYNIDTLPLNVIQNYVDYFIMICDKNPQLQFLVTKIGCGLAGYSEKEIAPLFKNAIDKNNIYLPKDFIEIILDN